MTRARHVVGRLAPGDVPLLLEHRRAHFGAQARQADREHLTWLFERNPACREPAWPVWIVKKDGVIAGEQAAIPIDIDLPSGPCAAQWAVDLMVNEEWRMRGVGPELAGALVRERPLSLAVNLSAGAYRAFVRAGWIDIGDVRTYVRPLRAVGSARAWSSTPTTAFALTMGLAPYVAAADLGALTMARFRTARGRRVDRFDESMDGLWDRVSAVDGRLRARRDSRWLAWRFDDYGAAATLERIVLSAHGAPVGYVVLRHDTWQGAPLAVVLDYVVMPSHRHALVAQMLRAAYEAEAVALVMRVLDSALEPVLRRTGFLRRGAGVGAGIPMLVHVADPSLLPAVADRKQWVVTSADSDLDLNRAWKPPDQRKPIDHGRAVVPRHTRRRRPR